MGLVVQHQNVLHAHQFGHDALKHLAFALQGLRLLSGAPLQQRPAALRQLQPLAQLERMVVGEDDPRFPDVFEHVARHQIAVGIVIVQIVGQQDPEAILDRDSWCHHKESFGEGLAAGTPHGVDRLPGDQHRHDGRLTRAGRELQREPQQLGIGFTARGLEIVQQPFAVTGVRRHLGQPDRRLHRLDLAEEGTDARDIRPPPMDQQPRGFRRHLPLTGIGQPAPVLDVAAHLVDGRRDVISLLFGRESLVVVEP
jgi:hypothetical protein